MDGKSVWSPGQDGTYVHWAIKRNCRELHLTNFFQFVNQNFLTSEITWRSWQGFSTDMTGNINAVEDSEKQCILIFLWESSWSESPHKKNCNGQ